MHYKSYDKFSYVCGYLAFSALQIILAQLYRYLRFYRGVCALLKAQVNREYKELLGGVLVDVCQNIKNWWENSPHCSNR